MHDFEPAFDDMKETFARFDKNRSGKIEFGEFMALMREMDHERSEVSLRQQFATIDTNSDGQISFAEFHTWFGADR